MSKSEKESWVRCCKKAAIFSTFNCRSQDREFKNPSSCRFTKTVLDNNFVSSLVAKSWVNRIGSPFIPVFLTIFSTHSTDAVLHKLLHMARKPLRLYLFAFSLDKIKFSPSPTSKMFRLCYHKLLLCTVSVKK